MAPPRRCSSEMRRWRRSCGDQSGIVGRPALLRYRGAERVGAEACEQAGVGVAVLARAELLPRARQRVSGGDRPRNAKDQRAWYEPISELEAANLGWESPRTARRARRRAAYAMSTRACSSETTRPKRLPARRARCWSGTVFRCAANDSTDCCRSSNFRSKASLDNQNSPSSETWWR